jgi:quercetin dioxygenase-like cupin family protein
LPEAVETTGRGLTTAEPDRGQVAAGRASRRFSRDRWTDLPGLRWENFPHATGELVCVLEGQVEFEVAGQVHRPKVGEELLSPARTAHSARNVGKTTARWLYGYRRPG